METPEMKSITRIQKIHKTIDKIPTSKRLEILLAMYGED